MYVEIFIYTYYCNNAYRYGNTWIKVDRTREQQTLDLHMGIPWETVTLTAFGRNKQIYYNILEEGMAGQSYQYSIFTIWYELN